MPFTKGQTPWNKGIKTGIVPKTAFKKGQRASVKTEFKKGQPSWNKGKHIWTGGGTKKGVHVGNKSPAWKGGITHTAQGYIEERYAPYKHKTQHRLVMEKHLGRKLKNSEHIHHINGMKTDNRIENLELHTASSHNSLEHKLHPEKYHYFKKGNPPPPHKNGCTCFRCTKK